MVVVERVTNYFPFECKLRELIVCVRCRRRVGRKQIVGTERIAKFLSD